MNRTVLEVNHLRTDFFLEEGVLKALDGVSFKVGANETLGIIGESGCGKSVMAQSILRIVPFPGKTLSGQILLTAREGSRPDLAQLPPFGKAIRAIRGKDIAMVFQEPEATKDLPVGQASGSLVGQIPCRTEECGLTTLFDHDERRYSR